MASIPGDLLYTTTHEWVRREPGGTVSVGLTDFAQRQLGDVVFLELPGAGDSFDAEEAVGTVESVKAVSEFYAPFGCEVVEVNTELAEEPEQVNDDPYDCWLYRARPSDPGAVDGLLDAEAYAELLREEAEE
ncbi:MULTISPECIES: glycine cleavage system protein GcvH [Nocardiopsis]|uniref:Glycine cleavage system H protein n=1 Tax=Nocardiopsis dassonvillei (strain ATCC 23218 / DSM 43111 / CIP 107115 / JCM 7437 / KCTC 9190 / NBRC 14626 / NCTC 10488 / NRRL B-5397 / IMRU 509) TaxID=446468 RepID=D7B1A6_NOCDD|nr:MULTISPECIES: glycine cleavage system protein GcvH [Nocardiopsis]ADH66497.1 glycine cleavage system H protein [Nocardiopsis dassonvillei subsp. dassonvillei DSM 43111]APC34808.1 glycine cleavage system protein H [Nocardiopsis dassonvillei]NKY79926.1 glycine cleavage system protein GcvH [Nocardiopsis dassonvillei]VEI92518.1 Glycine cleavage system H protein [Nocardiopsis dassonvillei]